MSRCHTINIYPPCPSNCPESTSNTFQNANLAGVGVFDSDGDGMVSFRGIEGDGTYITVTENTTNKTAVIGLNAENISGSVPLATESVAGKLEVATTAETAAGTLDNRIVTPLKLAGLSASTTQKGLVELATDAEAQAFSSSTLALTPANLGVVVGSLKVQNTVANAAARGALAPAYVGQLLVQNDTQEVYIGQSTASGSWAQFAPSGGGGTENITVINTADPTDLTLDDVGLIVIENTGTPGDVTLPAAAPNGTSFRFYNASGTAFNLNGQQSDRGNTATLSSIVGYNFVAVRMFENVWRWEYVRGTSEITGA